jgi:hypothetical protein
MSNYLTFLEAAKEILIDNPNGLHYKEITNLAIKKKLIPPASENRRTPHASLNTELIRANQKAERN